MHQQIKRIPAEISKHTQKDAEFAAGEEGARQWKKEM